MCCLCRLDGIDIIHIISQILTMDRTDMFDHLYIFYTNSIIYKLYKGLQLFILYITTIYIAANIPNIANIYKMEAIYNVTTI